MASRFYSQRDIDTFDKFNKELVGDLSTGSDGIIYQPVVLYKVSVYDTEMNMYGECYVIPYLCLINTEKKSRKR